MPQQVDLAATVAENLNLTLGTHIVGKEDQLLKIVFWPPHVHTCFGRTMADSGVEVG